MPTEGRKISEKHYDYLLNVLPPLIWGISDIIAFLQKLDKNPELISKIKKAKPIDGFMQGEGIDHHDIFIQTKEGYFKIGRTRQTWNTEMFRYNDWKTMSDAEIRRYNFR